MKTNVSLLFVIAVLAVAMPFASQAAPQVYDLKTDWNNTQNPNGTWSFYDSGFLELMSNDPFPWVDHLWNAVLTKTSETDAVPGVLEIGDIYGHDDYGGAGHGPGIRWTAPADGAVDISGAIWNTWDDPSGGNVGWFVSINGNLLSEGDSQGSSRSQPADFSAAWRGPDVLLNIPVKAGDRVELSFVVFVWPVGSPFGINFTIAFTPDSVDPASAIEDLALTVVAMNLQNGIENSLDSKLDAALNALDDVNANNDEVACNSLQSFIKAVEVQRGAKITDAQADQLITSAQQIQASLNCGD